AAFCSSGTRFGSSPRPRAPPGAPRAQRGGWTRGAASSPKAAGLQAGHPFRPDATSLGDGARGLGAATDPVGEGVGHAFLVGNCTYLLIDLPRARGPCQGLFRFVFAPEARPPRKSSPRALETSGDSLDLLGEIYGVPRLGQSSVQSDLADRNFEFYVRRGTFGDINGGNSIEISSDARISTGDPNGAIYLTDPVTLAAGDSRAFFSARSLAPGSVSNAPAGVFNRHNFTGYTDSRFGTLLVTNHFGLVGGRDAESDDDYRFRLNLKIQSRAGANEAALRLELLEIPGIQDVVFERQAGAFIVYVYGISPNVSPGLLQNVQDRINDKAAYPLTGLAVAPDLVGISLSTTIQFKAGTSAEEKSLALSAAASAAEDYINI